jgi:monoamine oxidase
MIRARRLFAASEQAERSGMPVEEVLGRAGEAARRTRREFLIGAGGLGAGAALARNEALARPIRSTALKAMPRIAIVGAGLAGLRCAHMLWTQSPGAPVRSTV